MTVQRLIYSQWDTITPRSKPTLTLFFLIPILLCGCGDNEQVTQSPPYLKLQHKNISTSYLAYTKKLKISSNVEFDIEPKEYCYWVDYNNIENGISIELSENYSEKERQCILIVKNDNHNISDTLTIIQFGRPIPPSGGGGNGGSISGGGSTSTSKQCAARTKEGTRCKRTASKGNIYCWQHK